MRRGPRPLGNYPALHRLGFVDQRGRPLASASYDSRMRAGGFESGSTARRFRGWMPAASGPNASYWGDLELTRSRSRHEIRNNSLGQAAVRSFVGNAVGTGITPRWRHPDKAVRTYLRERWRRWIDECDADGQSDFNGLQALVAATMFGSGEAFARIRPRRARDGLSVPMQLQVLEPDYLDSSKHGDEGSVHRRLGVELDAIGQRTAYWMHPTHPGDGLSLSLQSHRVRARDVIHVYRVDRPGQVRGVPWLAPVLTVMHALDKYEDAELVRKQIAAMFAAFVTKDAGGEDPLLGVAGSEESDEQNFEATLEPGLVQYLTPGEDIKFSSPADVGPSYAAFIQSKHRMIATGVGVTYEQLTGDLRGVSYSSIRSGLLEFRRHIEAVQWHVLIYQLCRRVMNAWLDYGVAWGALDLPGYREDPWPYRDVEWCPAGWDWVDPQRDINAAIAGINAGIETREAVVAKRGYHVEEIDETNAIDVARMRELDLKYTTDVGADREGGPASVQSDPDKDEEETRDKRTREDD